MTAAEAGEGGDSSSVTLHRGDLPGTEVKVAVFRKKGWRSELTLEVATYSGSCEGMPVELIRSSQPILLEPNQIAEWAATLRAKDLDRDGYAAPGAGVIGDDCDDIRADVNPGAAERCGEQLDYDCDGYTGCVDPGCDGQSCSDQNACTQGETCEGSVCQGGSAVVCPPPSVPCRLPVGSCAADAGCQYALVAPGGGCDGGVCGADGVCLGAGSELNCADGLDDDGDGDTDCVDPDCRERSCNDGLACTENDVCSTTGTTCSGTEKVCNNSPGGCFEEAGTCQPSTGQCTYAPRTGESCTDGNACTTSDQCLADGGCSGTAVVCNSALGCFANPGTCNLLTGVCDYSPNTGASCDDSAACTRTDQCLADGGCAGEAYSCTTPPSPAECYENPGDCDGAGGCSYPVNTSMIGETASSCATPPTECFQSPGTCAADGGCSYAVDSAKVGEACDGGSCQSDGGCVPDTGYAYTPSNFDPAAIPSSAISDAVSFTGSCSARFDSTPGAASDGFVAWCGQPQPTPHEITQSDGSKAVVLAMRGLTIASTASFRLGGTRPVILAIYGDASIDGPLRAHGSPEWVGPGGNRSGCGAQTGGDGGYMIDLEPYEGSGGGGGGFGTAGAAGGQSAAATGGGAGGAALSSSLSPLLGGCPGGVGGRESTTAGVGGNGGGALQISASGELSASSIVTVSGGGGGGGGQDGNEGAGGGGGGSGGGLLLEGGTLKLLSTAKLTANGGGGGEGGRQNSASGQPGQNGSESSASPASGGSTTSGPAAGNNGGAGGAGSTAPAVGEAGENKNGAGGGGGGVGIIRVKGHSACTVDGSCSTNSACIISPAATRDCPP